MSDAVLSIIVVSYNTRELTLECLRSVFSATHQVTFELVVLDNASEDGSANAIAAEFGKRVRLIVSPVNLGFAVGNNRAAEVATGEYLLLLNPDTLVLDAAIDNLLAFACLQPEAGIWGGRTLFGDGTLNPASCWLRQTLWSLFCQAVGLTSLFRRSILFNPEGMGGWNREGDRIVDIVSGCFLLIRKSLWDRLGGFNEMFFMYGEEADLCLRAKALGAQPMVSSKATIIHYGGASETVRTDKLVRLMKAKMLLIYEHFPIYQRRLGYALLALWPWSRARAHRVIKVIRPSSAGKGDVWNEVDQRRREWYAKSQ